MSYQVIARKYRPQRFADVVGQEHVTRTLGNAIEQSRIAHAYLFSGPRGTGKTTIARIFAKCLNCTDGPKVEFAEDDPRCEEIAEGRSLDVYEIDGASNNGVDQVRELRETCQYAPANSPYKIYIIDEVHMLSTAAFNALLKTLEEPPEHVKFMFATTDPEKVLPTILSRCQRFDLRRIPAGLIVEHLAMIAKQEGVTIDDPALYAIARGADGGMRDAESTLDQLISFCGNTIQESDVLSVFGLTARGQIVDMAGAILGGDVPAALALLDELAKNGKDLSRLLSDLLAHFRNLLVYSVSRGDMGLLEVSEAEAAALAEQAQSASEDALTRVMEVLSDSEGRFRDATSKKILLEVALMKAIQGRQAMSIDAVLGKLQELRGEGLIRAVADCSKVPVIKHYKGVCHVYVDGDADADMAREITLNSKLHRVGVCNAIETLLIDRAAADQIPALTQALLDRGVELRVDADTRAVLGEIAGNELIKDATEEDWAEEYLDKILAVRVVDGVAEAIGHINQYGSGHTDTIVTANEARAKRFLNEVDSAAVYWNASTRFTDGGMYGMGAEIGISTDKIGARGPMGLEELTSYKWLGTGTGQIRE